MAERQECACDPLNLMRNPPKGKLSVFSSAKMSSYDKKSRKQKTI
jgi:hypothetical protein